MPERPGFPAGERQKSLGYFRLFTSTKIEAAAGCGRREITVPPPGAAERLGIGTSRECGKKLQKRFDFIRMEE